MRLRAARAGKNSATGKGAKVNEGEAEAGGRSIPNKAALVAVSTLVKNTALIGHHVIEGEKWDLDRDIKLIRQIEAADQKVAKVATEAGLSPEVEKSIRDALMEIKP